MATATDAAPEEQRTSKRSKQDDMNMGSNGRQPPSGMSTGEATYPPAPPQQPQQLMPPQQGRYQPPPGHYVGPGGPASQHPHMPPGYYGGGYGGHAPPPHGPPPSHWQGGPSPPPGHYPPPPPRGMSPERQGPPGQWNNGAYRGTAPPPPLKSRKPKSSPPDDPGPYYGGPPPPPPHYGNGPYGPPPPPPPPPPPGHYGHGPPAPMYASQGTWTGKTPPRVGRHRDVHHYRPEMDHMPTYRGGGQPLSVDDDGAGSSTGGSTKDKGRGSYKCGRCGVPKKGHVCPYQPKLKRRPDEPPPPMRTAAVQVEMDEFMTLRRLNIKIQGYPESYATEPYMSDTIVVGGDVHMTMVPPSASPELTHRSHPSDSIAMGSNCSNTINNDNVVVSLPTSASDAPMESPRDVGVGDGVLDVEVETNEVETAV